MRSLSPLGGRRGDVTRRCSRARGNSIRSAWAGRGAFVEPLERRRLLTSVVVNSTLDATFPPGSGMVSLRNAINTANASTTATTITFDPTVFAAPQTIKLNGTVLQLANVNRHPITITGPSANLTISGNDLSRVFEISAYNAAVTLSKLTISHGNGYIYGGGGIANSGPATTLTNVTVSGNTAYTGGISNGGSLNLTNVNVSGNTGTFNCGGFYNGGTANLTNVTISGNKLITHEGRGGGLYNGGTATLTNVTISGNAIIDTDSFGIAGGGIYNYPTSTIKLTNVTISGNTVGGGAGGGILNDGATANFTITNSIIAGNSGTSGPDAGGGFNSLGYNVVGKKDGSTGFDILDRVGTTAIPLSAKLGALANNGGATLTMLPLTGSPAIDHGHNAYVPTGITTDQRGLARIYNGTVDIGAVEVQSAIPAVSIVATDASATEPSTSTATATDTGLYTITRTGSTTAALTVSLTISGTATNGTDYSKIVSPVTIPSGAASTTIKLTPRFDTLTEAAETAIITLASSTAYTIDSTHKSATVSIHDPSKTPAASIVASDPSASESPAGPTSTGSFIVSRSGPTTAALTMTLTLSGTATYGKDFTLAVYGAASSSFNATTKQLTLTLAAGKTAASILITPLNDTLAESTETVILALKSSTAYGITAGKGSATMSIANFS